MRRAFIVAMFVTSCAAPAGVGHSVLLPYQDGVTVYLMDGPDDWLDDGPKFPVTGQWGARALVVGEAELPVILSAVSRVRSRCEILCIARHWLHEGYMTHVGLTHGYELAVRPTRDAPLVTLEYSLVQETVPIEEHTQRIPLGASLVWVIPQGSARAHWVIVHVASIEK